MSIDFSHIRNIEITGDVSIKPLPDKHAFREPFEMIMSELMGPTGAGKSTFIEALGKDHSLGISKDQLEGYTQKISAYELINAKWRRRENPNPPETIYLLDTPGFSDSKLSEMEIVLMLNDWMKAHKIRRIEAVIYACPITATRIPRSKRRTIEMLQSLARINENNNLTAISIATTMWNTVWNDQQRQRANNHFRQLQDDIWKDLTNRGGQVMKFTNTQVSALEIVDATMGDGRKFLALGGPVSMSGDRDYIPDLYQELLERIEETQQKITATESELSLPETQENDELKDVLEATLKEQNELLAKFRSQLIDFGDPPAGFGHVVIPWHNLSKLGRVRQGYHLAKSKGKKFITFGRHGE
ncbi:hypothetical protein CVT24_001809 [Panaeolus cyanescens]|uniref:G domain-containing protein n=1 Tax=Panaeolus cyanescens TaxID=181874 RepID=A0A409YFI0_9AGAR|nr:hypothetical protein CVT24_001809 [Panaeolus cyanescens]